MNCINRFVDPREGIFVRNMDCLISLAHFIELKAVQNAVLIYSTSCLRANCKKLLEVRIRLVVDHGQVCLM